MLGLAAGRLAVAARLGASDGPRLRSTVGYKPQVFTLSEAAALDGDRHGAHGQPLQAGARGRFL